MGLAVFFLREEGEECGPDRMPQKVTSDWGLHDLPSR